MVVVVPVAAAFLVGRLLGGLEENVRALARTSCAVAMAVSLRARNFCARAAIEVASSLVAGGAVVRAWAAAAGEVGRWLSSSLFVLGWAGQGRSWFSST